MHPKISVYKLALYPHNQEQKLKPNSPAQSQFVESTANTNKTTTTESTVTFLKNILASLVSSCQLNAHFLYSIKVYMLHYNPQHVSSSTLLIFRWTNYIITASGIVTLCKRPHSMPVDSGQSAVNACVNLVTDSFCTTTPRPTTRQSTSSFWSN